MKQRRNLLALIPLCLSLIASESVLSASPVVLPTTVLPTSRIQSLVPHAPELNAKGFVLMDMDSGQIIAAKNSNQRMQPASLTKLMTLYVTFGALKEGQIHLNDKVYISTKAWHTGGSRMFLKQGSRVSVQQLIQGIIVASGNDACVAIAEFIAGNEKTFTELMNQTAKQLGMNNSHFVDSTGMPNNDHYSTPQDLAVLTQALIRDFPEYYHFFSQKWLRYNNIKQPNRNRLLWYDHSVDGLKTGHTDSAGYCLIASAKRNDMRLISVVMDTPSDHSRAHESAALLNYGFRFYDTYPLFKAHQSITHLRVWYGKQKYMNFGLATPLTLIVPKGQYKSLKAKINMPQRLVAPINKNKPYGNVVVSLNGQQIAVQPLVALKDDQRAGLWTRFWDSISLFFKNLFRHST